MRVRVHRPCAEASTVATGSRDGRVEGLGARREAVRPSRHGTKFITANGLRFAYLEEGTGPLVLLVHGFPDTAHTWDAVRPAIAALGFRVVSPFTRAYAPTEIPKAEDYGADTLGADVLALIAALGEESAIVVGHDFGAGAAFAAASLGPSHVRLLVTVAIPHPASAVPTPRLLWAVRHFFTLSRAGAAAKIRAGGFAHIDELVARWSPGWNVPAGETDAVKRALREPGCLEAVLGYYRALGVRPPQSHRGRIKVPSVAFAGTTDVVAPEAYERARSRYTAGYEIVVMPGGHFMHREHPAHFIRELSRVLAPYRA